MCDWICERGWVFTDSNNNWYRTMYRPYELDICTVYIELAYRERNCEDLHLNCLSTKFYSSSAHNWINVEDSFFAIPVSYIIFSVILVYTCIMLLSLAIHWQYKLFSKIYVQEYNTIAHIQIGWHIFMRYSCIFLMQWA